MLFHSILNILTNVKWNSHLMHASADYRGQLGFHRDSKFSNFLMLFTANSLSHPHVSNVNNPELGKDFETLIWCMHLQTAEDSCVFTEIGNFLIFQCYSLQTVCHIHMCQMWIILNLEKTLNQTHQLKGVRTMSVVCRWRRRCRRHWRLCRDLQNVGGRLSVVCTIFNNYLRICDVSSSAISTPN